MRRFVSLPHSVTCNTGQLCCKGIKATPDVFWDLNITFKYFVSLKKVNSNILSFNLIISDKSGYQKRNYSNCC